MTQRVQPVDRLRAPEVRLGAGWAQGGSRLCGGAFEQGIERCLDDMRQIGSGSGSGLRCRSAWSTCKAARLHRQGGSLVLN